MWLGTGTIACNKSPARVISKLAPSLLGGAISCCERLHIKAGHGIFKITNRTTKLKVFVISSDLLIRFDLQGVGTSIPELVGYPAVRLLTIRGDAGDAGDAGDTVPRPAYFGGLICASHSSTAHTRTLQ